MLNTHKKKEINDWLKYHKVPKQKWGFILKSIEYDLWEVKGKETNAVQRNQLKKIKDKSETLLQILKELSWELSEELHQELETELDNSRPHIHIDEYEDENFDFRNEFETAIDEGLSKEELIFIHENQLEKAFSKVPIDGDANIFKYLSKLASSCQNLIEERKQGPRDKKLYTTLMFRCERIAEDHSFDINQEQIFKFICACTGKPRDTVKQQFNRLELVPSKKTNEDLKNNEKLENKIVELNRKKWELIFNQKIKDEGKVSIFWIHWELVELYNIENRQEGYSEFLKNIIQNGIGDILRKYGLNCHLL